MPWTLEHSWMRLPNELSTTKQCERRSHSVHGVCTIWLPVTETSVSGTLVHFWQLSSTCLSWRFIGPNESLQDLPVASGPCRGCPMGGHAKQTYDLGRRTFQVAEFSWFDHGRVTNEHFLGGRGYRLPAGCAADQSAMLEMRRHRTGNARGLKT